MKTILAHRKKSPAMPESEQPKNKPAPKFTPRGIQSKQRILVAVKDERIDFSAMSSDSAKQLNELLHKPEVQAQFNLGPNSDKFDPRHCKRIYEAIAIFEMAAAKFALKWPNEAIACLQFTEAEKDELAQPTASALDELAPKWLRENQAVAALALVFTAIQQKKFQEAAFVARQIRVAKMQTIPREPAQETEQRTNGEEKPKTN